MSSLSKKEVFNNFLNECDSLLLKDFLLANKNTFTKISQEQITDCLQLKELILSLFQEEDFLDFMFHYYLFEKEKKTNQEKECQKKYKNFEILTRHGNAVFFMIDPTTMNFIFSKGKGLRKLGLEQDQVVGKPVVDYYGDNESVMKWIHQAAKGKERRGNIDVGHICFDVNFTPVFDQEGNISEIVGMAFDTTKHKNLARKLKEANLTKDKFFSIIAHDLKSPFGAILGFLELLQDNLKELSMEEIEERLNLIESSATRSYNLLVRLLERARAQSSVAIFNPEDFDLYQESMEQINLLEDIAKKKNILLENTIPQNTNVYADKRMINSIVRNLVSNAIKFTGNKEEPAKITIWCKQIEDNLLFSIVDTGIGMKPEQKEALFQIDKIFSTRWTANEQWSGLGLLLCKEFIEKHDGKIRVEQSEKGRWTTIQFTIPINEKEEI